MISSVSSISVSSIMNVLITYLEGAKGVPRNGVLFKGLLPRLRGRPVRGVGGGNHIYEYAMNNSVNISCR